MAQQSRIVIKSKNPTQGSKIDWGKYYRNTTQYRGIIVI